MTSTVDEPLPEEGHNSLNQQRGRRQWAGRIGRVLLGLLLVGVVLLFALEYALLTGAVDIPVQYLREAQPTAEANAAMPPNPVQSEPVDVDAELISQAPGKGDPNAPVVMVEFNDYQCAFCKAWTTEVAPHLQPYIDRGDLRFVVLDATSPAHPYAVSAAQAAHCAREEGGDQAYWTMYDTLFATMDEWSNPGQQSPESLLASVASRAGLDGDHIATCLEQGSHAASVDAGREEAARIGVMGTPTFLINGTVVYGMQPLVTFQQVIEQALRERQ